MINRRNFLLGSSAVSAVAVMGLLPTFFPRKADAQAKAEKFEFTLTDEQWHQKLNDDQYHILREAGTEHPYSSPLNNEHRVGEFACAGCNLPLFQRGGCLEQKGDSFGFSRAVTAQQLPPKPTKEGYDEPSLESPRLKLRAIARWLCFSHRGDRLEILPLRGAFITGLQPLVCNLSFSKLSELPVGF